jgi:hypothetical protein
MQGSRIRVKLGVVREAVQRPMGSSARAARRPALTGSSSGAGGRKQGQEGEDRLRQSSWIRAFSRSLESDWIFSFPRFACTPRGLSSGMEGTVPSFQTRIIVPFLWNHFLQNSCKFPMFRTKPKQKPHRTNL